MVTQSGMGRAEATMLDTEGGGKWVRCKRQLEGIQSEYSEGERSTPSRTPSPETLVADKMVGGKLWMKVPRLVIVGFTLSFPFALYAIVHLLWRCIFICALFYFCSIYTLYLMSYTF